MATEFLGVAITEQSKTKQIVANVAHDPYLAAAVVIHSYSWLCSHLCHLHALKVFLSPGKPDDSRDSREFPFALHNDMNVMNSHFPNRPANQKALVPWYSHPTTFCNILL